MKQYFTGFFTALCLALSFFVFSGANKTNLGDITVNSIKVVDDGSGGYIITYNSDGERTSFLGTSEGGLGKVATYNLIGSEINLDELADEMNKKFKEFTHRLRENELRIIRWENDMYEAKELIMENNGLIYKTYDELAAEIDERIEVFRRILSDKDAILMKRGDQLAEFQDDIADTKQMTVENINEIHHAFNAIIDNTKLINSVKESLTKRILELYGPY